MSTLQGIEFPESLKSLNLIYCDTLLDISQLLDIPELQRLNLTASDGVNHAGIYQNLESLRWISLPGNLTQGEFDELCGSLEQIEMVEIYDCENIEDLLPLRKMDQLRILSLGLEQNQLRGLDSLDQLELLILTEELFDDNTIWISELKSSLPGTKIVPGSGLCLGSGWLLLLLPLILFSYFTFRRKTSPGVS
jgi:hypothetical protein